MKIFLHAIAAAILLLLAGFLSQAEAQTTVRTSCAPTNPYVLNQTGRPFSIDENGNTCINGSITASLAGFTPGGTYATLTATGSSASVALPAGTTVYFQNTGTTSVSCTLGVGSATATANQIIVPPSTSVPEVVGSNTFGACIDQTGSASNLVVLAGGSGLGTAFGGGGSGSGGGGAITAASGSYASGALSSGSVASGAFASGSIASGAMVDLGAIADAAASVGGTGTVEAKLRLMTTQLDAIQTSTASTATGVAAAIPDCGADPCTNRVGLTYNRPATGTYTNRSGAITTGGTSQTLAASNTTRRQLLIQNPCTATEQNIATAENLFVNFTSAATTAGGDSIELLPCGSVQLSQGTVTTEAITVIGATTAHKWIAKEM